MARYRVGIDTGGTFTDVVAIDVTGGSFVVTKTPSTPDDPSRALAIGLDKGLSAIGADRSALDSLIHGTTVATNALLEERFNSLALVTTASFRHILEIARQSVPSGYGNSYFWVKPDRIVPLERVFEVRERLNHLGEVLHPLIEADARRIGASLRETGVEAVAICLIHAYANGAHERRVREILLEEYPALVVSISSDVLREYREYERAMTTCIDAYVKPVMKRYIDRAVAALSNGSDKTSGEAHVPFLIMQSNGGTLFASEVARQPITTLLSGPAAGALGASYLAGLSGYDHVLTVDAGGTSTDICLVDAGVPHITAQGSVGRFPVRLPMVDVRTIGTGGGSIAWIDPAGGIRVGPKSAGADPGPMCYGRGGTEPTLTDANVALGRLPPSLLGGEMNLDVDLAWQGLTSLAQKVGIAPERLAAGVVEIADWNQVNAIRQVTVKKGLDPRNYTMVAFGGSGPLQAPTVATILGMDTVVVPQAPGNVSAFGLLSVDLKADYVATLVQREDRIDLDAVNGALADLEKRADHDLSVERVPFERRRFVRSIDIRYFGEAYELAIDAPAGEIDAECVETMTAAFHREHVRRYGYSYEGRQLCELVNMRVVALGLVDRPSIAEARLSRSTPLQSFSSRDVYLPEIGFQEISVFERESIPAGEHVSGPAVVQEYGSTTVVPPGWVASSDTRRNLILERSSARS